jgi:hypothetical protein
MLGNDARRVGGIHQTDASSLRSKPRQLGVHETRAMLCPEEQ